ncbi:MAG: hypothetical protein WDW21_03670 [Neisseriaceae bacterium]
MSILLPSHLNKEWVLSHTPLNVSPSLWAAYEPPTSFQLSTR